jgi:type IV pilus assembly protein PilE
MNRRVGGFTLIELMITLAIVAILASVAYPSYTSHVRKGVRRSAQAQMMDLAHREQLYLAMNKGYASYSTLTAAGYTLPTELSTKYTPSISCTPACDAAAATTPSFTITFQAIGSQLSDGDLTLNSEGVKTPSTNW